MKKMLWFLVFVAVILTLYFNLAHYISNVINSYIVDDLRGRIYYIKAVEGLDALYTSNADLNGETLVYSHEGKGEDSSGYINDNVVDFRYDAGSGKTFFVAMHAGDWYLYSLKDGSDRPALIEMADLYEDSWSYMVKTDYLKTETEELEVREVDGSLYVYENGEGTCVKKFYGLYDEGNTGYKALGFSPNGKYLVYRSMEHLTPVGAWIEKWIKGEVAGKTYVMELDTCKSTWYIDAEKIQWLEK